MSAKPVLGDYLDQNLATLETAADAVREEFDYAAIKRFYHMTLLECAEFMPAEVFARCVNVAREQMRRPL